MTDLFVPLLTAAAFLGFWALDVFRASAAICVMYAVVVVIVSCLALYGLIHLQVPKTWGAPTSNVLVALGAVGGAIMALRGVQHLRREVR